MMVVRVLSLLLAIASSAACASTSGLAVPASCPAAIPTGGTCRILPLPEQPNTPNGRTIDVLVVRFPALAANPRPDPALIIVGGPGQAASALAVMLVTRFAGVRESRDLILVDQRGTGGSNRLGCSSSANTDPARLLGPPYTETELASCAAALAQRADLNAYSTTNAVDDLERVRVALGVRTWNLLGASYGTKVAMEYARRFPATTRSLVLEGVAGPEYPNPLPHARAGQAALDSLLVACSTDARCNAAYPALREHLHEVFARLERAPATVTVPGRSGPPVTMGRDELAYGLHLLLFSNTTSPAIPFLVSRAHARDYWPIANVLAQVTSGLVSGIDIGMQLSVTCAEDAAMFDPATADRETAGTYLRNVMTKSIHEECSRWPVRPTTPLPVVPLDAPALLLSGAYDPATPPSFARAIAARMPRATSLTVPYGAHVTSDRCIENLIRRYLDALSLTPAETACLSHGRRPPFLIPGG